MIRKFCWSIAEHLWATNPRIKGSKDRMTLILSSYPRTVRLSQHTLQKYRWFHIEN